MMTSIRKRDFLLFAAYMAAFNGTFTYGVLIPVLPILFTLQNYTGDTLTYYNTLASALASAGYLLAAIIMGHLSDHWPTRHKSLFVTTSVIFAVSVAGLCFFQNTIAYMISHFGLGVAQACLFTLGLVIMTNACEPHENSRVLGIFVCFYATGEIVGPLVGGWMADNVSLLSPLYVCLGLACADVLMRSFITVKSPPAANAQVVSPETTPPKDSPVTKRAEDRGAGTTSQQTSSTKAPPELSDTAAPAPAPAPAPIADTTTTTTETTTTTITTTLAMTATSASTPAASDALTPFPPATDTRAAPTTATTTTKTIVSSSLLAVLTTPEIYLIGAAHLLLSITYVGFRSVYAVYLKSVFGLSPSDIGTLSLAYTIPIAVTSLLTGVFVDRTSQVLVMVVGLALSGTSVVTFMTSNAGIDILITGASILGGNTTTTTTTAAAAAATSVLPFANISTTTMITTAVTYAVFGAMYPPSYVPMYPLLLAIARRHGLQNVGGKLSAFDSVVAGLGSVLGPLMIGAIPNYTQVFAAVSATSVAYAVVLLVLLRRYRLDEIKDRKRRKTLEAERKKSSASRSNEPKSSPVSKQK